MNSTTIRRIITKPSSIRQAIHEKVLEAVRKKFESIAKRMIKYLLFARSHEIWQREIL